MKINKIYTLLALFFLGTMVSCMDEADFNKVWDGLEVEFDASTLPNGITQNYVRNSLTQTDVANLQINLVGAPQTSPVTVTVEADPESTAVAGVHYTLENNTVTIPAGEVIAQLPVNVLTGNIDPSETPDLILKITSSTGAKVSVNYSDLTFRIRVICPSDLVGTYSVFWQTLITGDGEGGADQTINDFVIGAAPTVELTEAGIGVYQLSDMSFGLYPGLYSDSAPSGTISDNCNTILGAASNADQYGDPFTITGLSVPEEGIVNISWNNTWGDGGTIVLTKE